MIHQSDHAWRMLQFWTPTFSKQFGCRCLPIFGLKKNVLFAWNINIQQTLHQRLSLHSWQWKQKRHFIFFITKIAPQPIWLPNKLACAKGRHIGGQQPQKKKNWLSGRRGQNWFVSGFVSSRETLFAFHIIRQKHNVWTTENTCQHLKKQDDHEGGFKKKIYMYNTQTRLQARTHMFEPTNPNAHSANIRKKTSQTWESISHSAPNDT